MINQRQAKAALEQEKALPDKILEEMVSVLRGNKKLFLRKAKFFRAENADWILSSRYHAEKGLLRKHGVLKEIKGANEKILRQTTDIVNTAMELREMLLKIPEAAKDSYPNLLLHLQIYLYKGADDAETRKREKALLDFPGLLEDHISVFEGIQKTLESSKKNRNPNVAETLSVFVEVIARMYEATTQKKFTVSPYGDYLTEGMFFIQKSLPLLHTPASEIHVPFSQILSSERHTDGTFHSACRYASTAMKSTGKKKGKNGKNTSQ